MHKRNRKSIVFTSQLCVQHSVCQHIKEKKLALVRLTFYDCESWKNFQNQLLVVNKKKNVQGQWPVSRELKKKFFFFLSTTLLVDKDQSACFNLLQSDECDFSNIKSWQVFKLIFVFLGWSVLNEWCVMRNRDEIIDKKRCKRVTYFFC